MTAMQADLTLSDGRVLPSLAPLIQRLQLPWDYTVLASYMEEDDPTRTYAVIRVVKSTDGRRDEYVLYRVDPRDGSCHGGVYCDSPQRAMQHFLDLPALRMSTMRKIVGVSA